MNLTGSIAVVAGATGGLGRGVARELLAAGADVRVLVRDVRKLDPQLAGCRAAECEITDVRAMRAALGSLVDVGEKLSVVVNAGIERIRGRRSVEHPECLPQLFLGRQIARLLVAVSCDAPGNCYCTRKNAAERNDGHPAIER